MTNTPATQAPATQAEHVDAQFGARAEAYVRSKVHATGADLQRLADILRTFPDAALLDLGCGGGHVAFTAAPLVRKVVACDLSPRMLAAVRAEAARRGLDRIETAEGVAEALPFADAAFDAVVTRYSAHHWQDFEAGLREARRVLKPGGLAVFIDTAGFTEAAADTALQTIELLRDPSHVRNRSLPEWIAALGRAGFAVEDARTGGLPMSFADWLARMAPPETHAAAIRSLLAALPETLRARLGIAGAGTAEAPPDSWTVPTVFITARPGA